MQSIYLIIDLSQYYVSVAPTERKTTKPGIEPRTLGIALQMLYYLSYKDLNTYCIENFCHDFYYSS